MKLLELLVQELPPRGGWPEGAKNTIEMHHDGAIFFDGICADNFHLPLCSDGWRMNSSEYSNTDDGFWSNEVTREQYEEALAASRYYVEWDGEGLPPVGVKCEVYNHLPLKRKFWKRVEIMYVSEFTVVMRQLDDLVAGEIIYDPSTLEFRPIRTEEENRKREDAISNICFAIGVRPNNTVVQQTYDAIAAGKIPGVGLTN